MADISVIICTHNPRRDYLHRVLEALNRQTLPKNNWELLVVDNGSDHRLVDTCDLSWHSRARHVREDNLGLMAARLRGITEACGELMIFVDDDNVLASDFLEAASAVCRQYPFLGAFGSGSLQPEFEIPPPREIRSHLHKLALRSVSAPRWSNNVEDWQSVPWGAGLCVFRSVANSYLERIGGLTVSGVLGRKGHDLFCGDDDVFAWIASSAGLGFGVFPQLKVTHLIAARRLNRHYFLRLFHDQAFSHGVMYYVFGGVEPQIDWVRYLLLLADGVRHGPFSMRCKWVELCGERRSARFIHEQGLQPIE